MRKNNAFSIMLCLVVLIVSACGAGGGGGGTTTTNGPDKTAPSILNFQPPTGTVLAANTQSVPMSVTTNENATCRYSTTSGTAYGTMTDTFTTTGGTSHSTLIAGLANGQTYSRYIKCRDSAGNANTLDITVSWSVATVNNSNATLSWTPSVQGPTDGPTDGYAIFSCTTTAASCSNFGSAATATVAGSTSSIITLSSLPTGTNCFGVKAYNSAYYSVNYANCISTNNCCKRIQ